MKSRTIVPCLLIALSLIVGSQISPNFLDANYLMESATLFADTGLIAIAMVFVIASGQIDLSVGSMTVLSACLTAKLLNLGLPPIVGVLAGVTIGSGLGAINAALIHGLRASSFLVTVGTMALYRGLAQGILGANSIAIPNAVTGIDTKTFIGLTIPLWIVLASTGLGVLVLSSTVFGRQVVLFGSNPTAAEYVGISSKRLTTTLFIVSGFACGVASFLMSTRYGLVRHDFAKGVELDAITMAIVGGTSIRGGEPNVLGAFLSFLLIALLRTVMGIANVSAEFQLTAIGVLLIAAVMFNNLSDWVCLRLAIRSTKLQ